MDTSESRFVPSGPIDWYRTPIDKAQLRELMVRRDALGWLQTLAHLSWFATTAGVTYALFTALSAANWPWILPLLLIALFVHGTMGPFMGLIAVHELQHRTVFKTRRLNEWFERVYAFISWSDFVWYQVSHPIHHAATCQAQHDGEVSLPVRFSLSRWRTWLGFFAWNPHTSWQKLKTTWEHAQGRVHGDWNNYVLPEADQRLRKLHRRWAQTLLVGHGALALIFVLTGHWFLIVVFTLGTQYCNWLGFLCGVSQHYGLQSDVPDFRRNTRTFTCSWIPGFYYWNMQYHLEHHMYPAVPFYNLGKLRRAIQHDLPEAPHGLLPLWRHILELRRRSLSDPTYQYAPTFNQAGEAEATT